MAKFPHTPLSLIARIQSQDDAPAWKELLEIYGPVIIGFVRTKGLQDADVWDITQESLRAVAEHIGKFDPAPENGKFRNWLFVIVRSKLADHWRKATREPPGSGDPEVHQAIEEGGSGAEQSAWDDEYKQRLLHWAADQIREEFTEGTWQAFWLTGVEDRPVTEVAELLGMSANSVYVSKSRVLARLRAKVRQAEGE
jgi:RNA polymerase sigma factor (sigma-70 family)